MTQSLKAFAIALAVLTPLSARAQEDDGDTTALDDIPHVTILGTAQAEIAPDLADISLGVSLEKPRAVEAMAETSRIAAAVIETAKAQGVAPRDIATQNVTLMQTFDDIVNAKGVITGRKPRGFEASNAIVIRVRALDKAGALTQSLIDKGTTQFNGITFSMEHPESVMEKLYAEATRDAKRQAMISAEAIGAKLGRVLLIERPRTNSNGRVAPPVALSRMAVAAAPAVPIEAGTQTLATQMEVTWELVSQR